MSIFLNLKSILNISRHSPNVSKGRSVLRLFLSLGREENQGNASSLVACILLPSPVFFVCNSADTCRRLDLPQVQLDNCLDLPSLQTVSVFLWWRPLSIIALLLSLQIVHSAHSQKSTPGHVWPLLSAHLTHDSPLPFSNTVTSSSWFRTHSHFLPSSTMQYNYSIEYRYSTTGYSGSYIEFVLKDIDA